MYDSVAQARRECKFVRNGLLYNNNNMYYNRVRADRSRTKRIMPPRRRQRTAHLGAAAAA